MNNRQSGRRRRGGGSNAPRPMGQAIANQGGGNRLEVRVRGNAHQLLEKYKQLARDSHQSGDRVAAEYYLQHADHYFRVLNDVRIRQEEMRSRRGIFDPLDTDSEEDETAEALDPVEAEEGRLPYRHDPRPFQDSRDRREDREARDEADPRESREPRRRFEDRRLRDRREETGRGETGRGETGRREIGRGETGRGEAGREETGRGDTGRGEAAPLSDGEAALVAFGGRSLARPSGAEADDGPDEGVDPGAAAPKRRRTRTRRSDPAPADG